MIRVGVLGASGYAGAELVRLISQRDDLDLIFADSHGSGARPISSLYPNLRKFSDINFSSLDISDNESFDKIDVLFCALPHGLTQTTVQYALKRPNLKVIDLSADFRLRDKATYEAWYDTDHLAEEELKQAVYGLPELYRDEVKDARLVANPGCYPTSIILGLYPLIRQGYDIGTIISDSKSGVSGAGRGLKDPNLYGQASQSMKAYSIGSHRHTPEVIQELKRHTDKDIDLLFTPHLVPMNRGILSTMYVKNIGGLKKSDLLDLYKEAYSKEFFIRVLEDDLVQTKAVAMSNFVDIGLTVDDRTGYIVVTSAIDNLIKGASGQAMQNMNLMFGIEETKGLTQLPFWP